MWESAGFNRLPTFFLAALKESASHTGGRPVAEVLVVSGHNDIMVPTINSFTLSQNIPNAQLIIYPDAGHGALFQVPELFVAHAEMFLDA